MTWSATATARNRPTLAAVGAVAFLIRLFVALAMGGLSRPEVNEYNSMARAMLDGRGYIFGHLGIIYHSYAPPLHTWLTVASYWVAHSLTPLMLLQCVAGAMTAIASAAIAMRLFGEARAGLAAGLLVAINPGLVVYASTKAHPLTFDALFFTLALLQTLRVADAPGIARGVQFGAIVGIGALSRGTMVIFLPVAAVWLVFAGRGTRQRTLWRSVAVACVVAVLLIAPWSIRNTLVHHRFVWLLTTDGEDFWRGNNPYATGHSYITPGHTVLNALPVEERADLERQPDELAQSQWFMDRAMTYVKAHPAAFVRLTLTKLGQFWSYAPQTGVHYPAGWLPTYLVYYVAALVLAVAGARRAWASGGTAAAGAVLVLLFLLGLSSLQSLYYVEGRHRWAVEPMLLALSAGGATRLWERAARRSGGVDEPRA